jgi:hypothetical protein
VKVVKNKPAYFNQSMMEVTILELVRFSTTRGKLVFMLIFVAQQFMRSA